MIFQCHDLERALRSPELMPDARAHAEICERCRQELYLWSEISRVAPQLHREWESPALWPRIEAEMAAARKSRKVVPIWWWAAAAAAVIFMAAVLIEPWKPALRPKNNDFLTEDALRQVQQAEAVYARSIDRLSKLAGASLEQSPTPLAAAYREKLTVLDSAISELRANLAANRYNVYLQNQLASLYREKQDTLQEWLQNAKRN
jgi:hypothetical protein